MGHVFTKMTSVCLSVLDLPHNGQYVDTAEVHGLVSLDTILSGNRGKLTFLTEQASLPV